MNFPFRNDFREYFTDIFSKKKRLQPLRRYLERTTTIILTFLSSLLNYRPNNTLIESHDKQSSNYKNYSTAYLPFVLCLLFLIGLTKTPIPILQTQTYS